MKLKEHPLMIAAHAEVAARVKLCAYSMGLKEPALDKQISEKLGQDVVTRAAAYNWLRGVSLPKPSNAFLLETAAGKEAGFVLKPIQAATAAILGSSASPMADPISEANDEKGAYDESKRPQAQEVPIEVALSVLDLAAFSGRLTPAHRIRMKSILERRPGNTAFT